MHFTHTGRIRPIAAVLVLVLVVGLAPANGASAAVPRLAKRPRPSATWPHDAVPGSLLVTTVDGRIEHLEVPPGQEIVRAQALMARGDVAAVEPDHLRQPLRTPTAGNDPGYSEQWAHQVAGAEAAWDVTTGDPQVLVAVLDSGIDGTHPGIRANLVRQVDISSDQPVDVPLGTDNDRCDVGHGTFVAGVLGATGDDPNPLTGVAWRVGIVDIALSGQPRCLLADSAVLAGIQHATSLGVDVINLSLGGAGDTCPTAYQVAIDAARAADVVVVAAAGNSEQDFPGESSIPASCNGVISVGAVGLSGAPAAYSSGNRWVDLAAPGGDSSNGPDLVGLAEGGGTTRGEGTSFSAPYVAGAVALLRSLDPTISPDAVESVLEHTARGSGQRDERVGWGVVDVGAAVRRVVEGPPYPEPRPDPTFPVGLVVRVKSPTAGTTAVRQAIAMSRFTFEDGRAEHAVIARADDFADALAGSSLGFGVGPVLFTGRSGPLDPLTADELRRILPPGSTVYVLGGTAALPPSLEAEISALGLVPKRLAGTKREGTAAVVADEGIRRIADLGFAAPDRVILATAFSWPDAVTAGSMGAWYGYPILLTAAGSLSPETAAVLNRLRPEGIYVIGGTAAVSDRTAEAAGRAAGGPPVLRLAGRDRNETAVAVAQRLVADVRFDFGFDPLFAVAVNLRRADGFAHVLSASSAIGAHSGVFLPIDGDDGNVVPEAVRVIACEYDPLLGIAAGDVDVISDAARERLSALLEHQPSACP